MKLQKKWIALLLLIPVLAIGYTVWLRAHSATPMPVQPAAVSTQQPEQAANSVAIKNYAFSPKTLRVRKGTTVTWTNNDQAKHTITADGQAGSPGPNSPFFGQGQPYSYTFDTIGSYNYHCEPHPYMQGTVEVTE